MPSHNDWGIDCETALGGTPDDEVPALKEFVVFLDTGLTVAVPAGCDPDTDDGYRTLKAAAAEKFRALLGEDPAEFEIAYESTEEDDQ